MTVKPFIAVIGCGYWGKNLIRNFASLGVLKAVSDLDSNLANKFGKEYEVLHLSNDEIYNDPEIKAVAVAVPAGGHYEITKQVLHSGKHAFVEKPLAINIKDAEELVELAEKLDRKLMVGHILRYHGSFIKMREMINNGDIGELNYLYATRLDLGKLKTEKNVLWSLAPHDVSMILAITDSYPDKIKGHGNIFLQESLDDIAHIHMHFPTGVKAHLFVSWLNPFKEQKLVAIGDKAMLVFDDRNVWDEKLMISNYHMKKNGGNNVELVKDDGEFIQIERSEPLYNECKHFVQSIENNTTPNTDGREALRVLKIINQGCQVD